MGSLYGIIVTTHNTVGTLTLLMTIAVAIVLVATARTTSSLSSTLLRTYVLIASIQFVLGLILVIMGLVLGNAAYIGGLWFHFLFGIATVGVVTVMAARARRAPDSEARRYGLIFAGLVVLVLVTYLVGQLKYNPFG